ncbi:MAG: two-component system, response regulator YesN, partial [Clostridiales bacterium]|nr:two-component system, response regulator YesN [Clostridiales bacterium]
GVNLLIVDDEPLEVTIIEGMIQKEAYDLEEIYTAYSMRQAIEIMESHQVDILLSDIQMPKGSGHQLVEWTREHDLKVAVIFLTSHAVFEYAREAIRLNVGEYLLKPVEKQSLEKALFAAVETRKEAYQIEQNKRKAQVWNLSQNLWKQEFWQTLLFGSEDLPLSLILNHFEAKGIHYQSKTQMTPILIAWKHRDWKEVVWSNQTIAFVIKNVASEMLWGNTEIGDMVEKDGNLYVLFERRENTATYLYEKCEVMLKALLSYLTICDITIYIGEESSLDVLRAAVDHLKEAEENDIRKASGVVAVNKDMPYKDSYHKPEIRLWVSELMSGHYQKSLREIDAYLHQMENSGVQGQTILSRFQHDFLQELYGILQEKHIQASSIWKEENQIRMFNDAVKSIKDMKLWLREITKYLLDYQEQVEKSSDLIREITNYIAVNLEGELSRNELAEQVYLHPDYLSHIFKKQMGISISDYIIRERMNRARVLLSTTSDTISEIASKVGYPNTAYFTKLFKRATNMTPKEYRNAT